MEKTFLIKKIWRCLHAFS